MEPMEPVDPSESVSIPLPITAATVTTATAEMSPCERLREAAKRKIAAFQAAKAVEAETTQSTADPKEVVSDSPSPEIPPANRSPANRSPGPGRPAGTINPKPVNLPPYPSLINASIDPQAAIDDLLAYLGSIDPAMLGFWLAEYHRQITKLAFKDLLDKLNNPTVQELVALTGQNYQNVYMVMSGKGAIGLDRLNNILGVLGYGIKPVIVPLGVIAHDRVMAELGMLDYKGEVK